VHSYNFKKPPYRHKEGVRVRICLTLREWHAEKIVVPTNYNELIQGAIYRNISNDLAKFLHEKGFVLSKRRFKLFTFSRLLGNYVFDRRHGKFVYSGDVKLLISSPVKRFVKELANTILKKGFITLGENRLRVVEMAFPLIPHFDKEVKIRTLSPITVYSTLLTADGKKKTYYYSPWESEFSKLLDQNAKKKYFILKKRKLKSSLSIKPLRVKEVVVIYKGFVIKGWIGTFILSGPKSLIKTVYEAGLGPKNSQGFGMFEVM